MTSTSTATTDLVFDVHICAQRRSYVATFTGPDASEHAAAFIAARSATHAITLESGEPSDELSAILWPSCEHGMAAWLCAGPMHYPADNQF